AGRVLVAIRLRRLLLAAARPKQEDQEDHTEHLEPLHFLTASVAVPPSSSAVTQLASISAIVLARSTHAITRSGCLAQSLRTICVLSATASSTRFGSFCCASARYSPSSLGRRLSQVVPGGGGGGLFSGLGQPA